MNTSLSVIVPVYNANPYLRKCIDSIISQSFRDMEIILVDDGSNDGSSEICDEYAQFDNRIRVYHQTNKGPGFARNFGIGVSKGKYIGFVDCDDSIDECMYSEMISVAERLNVSMIMCGYSLVTNERECIVESPLKSSVVYGKDIIVNHILPELIGEGRFGYSAIWNKIYLRDFIQKNNLLMDEHRKHGEDWSFNLSVFDLLESFAVCNEPFYKYIQQNPMSLMRNFEVERFDYYYSGYLESVSIGKKYGINLDKAELNYVVQSYSYILSVITKVKQSKHLVKMVLDNKELVNCYRNNKTKVPKRIRFIYSVGLHFGATSVVVLMKIINSFLK